MTPALGTGRADPPARDAGEIGASARHPTPGQAAAGPSVGGRIGLATWSQTCPVTAREGRDPSTPLPPEDH